MWERRYAYVWTDGLYLDAGTEVEKTVLLCVVGARDDGEKELLAMESGYQESTESWAKVLRNLRNRGLEAPLVAAGDGALGLWAALDDVLSHHRASTMLEPPYYQRAGQIAETAPEGGAPPLTGDGRGSNTERV